MPHFAYYHVLTDDVVMALPQFNAPSGEDLNTQRVTFNPTDDIELDGSGANRPLLCYQVDLDDASAFKLKVQIRDQQGADRTISTWSFDGNDTRQFMDPFRLEWLHKGDHSIFFKRISGAGSVKIRNVVVFFQRDS